MVVDVTAVDRGLIDRLYQTKMRIEPIVIGAGQEVHWVDCVGQIVPKKELVTACNGSTNAAIEGRH